MVIPTTIYSQLFNHQDYNEKRTTDDWLLSFMQIFTDITDMMK